MVQKHILEFYPELELRLLELPTNIYRQPVLTMQSKASFRMFIFAKYIKRKFSCDLDLTITPGLTHNIVQVKKYTEYKGYKKGNRIKIKILPALVLDGIVLCQGPILFKKEMFDIVGEILYGKESGK